MTALRNVGGGAFAAALLLLSSMAEAQDPPRPRGSSLTGVALDSIRGGYLSGAVVFVSGTTLSAMTNSAGRFRIDGIPAGAHSIELQHPLLDTLAISLVTPPQRFSGSDSVFIVLGTPSAKTVVEQTCKPADMTLGPAAIVGTVKEATTDQPAVGAVVSVWWTEYEVGRRTIRNVPQRRTTSVAADEIGRAHVCTPVTW